MNKITWGLLGLLLTSILNVGFVLLPKSLKSDNNLSILFMRIVFIISGIISLLSFFIPNLDYNKNIISNLKKHIDYKLVIFFALFLLIAYITIPLAINKGGPVTFVIINFNVAIVMLYGIFFMKDPYDSKLILSLLIFLLSGAYTVIHQNDLRIK